MATNSTVISHRLEAGETLINQSTDSPLEQTLEHVERYYPGSRSEMLKYIKILEESGIDIKYISQSISIVDDREMVALSRAFLANSDLAAELRKNNYLIGDVLYLYEIAHVRDDMYKIRLGVWSDDPRVSKIVNSIKMPLA